MSLDYPPEEKGIEKRKKPISTGLEGTPPPFEKKVNKIYKFSHSIVRPTLPKDSCPSGNNLLTGNLFRPKVTGVSKFCDGKVFAKMQINILQSGHLFSMFSITFWMDFSVT